MGKHEWENLWNNRTVAIDCESSEKELLLELKRSSGFDVIGEGITYEALIQQNMEIRSMLFPKLVQERIEGQASIYEAGCGCGSNLYLFEKAGFQCGGLDYSKTLIEAARKILRTADLLCAGADQIPEEPLYDALLSYSVFQYFKNEEYAYKVLEKMYHKARFSIGLIDIHDKGKEQDFEAFRKKAIADYETRYQNLPKMFYSKDFFKEFAQDHDMEIIFTEPSLEGYWNNDFIFHCFMYK